MSVMRAFELVKNRRKGYFLFDSGNFVKKNTGFGLRKEPI